METPSRLVPASADAEVLTQYTTKPAGAETSIPSSVRRDHLGLVFWVLQIVGWSLYGLFYVLLFTSGRLDDPRALAGIAITYFVGLLVSVGLRYLYRRIRYASRPIWVLASAVVVAAVAGSHFWYWIDVFLSYLIMGGDFARFVPTFPRYLGNTYSLAIVLFTWSALYFGVLLWYDWRDEKERTEKARLLAHSAQLQMLRYQINPHFLFNSLNSIRALVDDNRGKARHMITALSDFLRYTLANTNNGTVQLHEEIDAIRRYFDIERIRYEEKLNVTFDIDPAAAQTHVPGFLVHPLVENAIKYGMRTSSMPLTVRVAATLEEGTLQIVVWNSGKWVPPSPGTDNRVDGTQTGLLNIRRRLEHSFPSRHLFEITETGGGVRAKMKISQQGVSVHEG